MNQWHINGETFKDEMANGYYGFVYKITFIPPNDSNLKPYFYIGKKKFKQDSRVKVEGRINRKRVSKFNYKNYYSSSPIIKDYIKGNKENKKHFDREILHLSTNGTELNYAETCYLIKNKVLDDNNYVNANIELKYYNTSEKNISERKSLYKKTGI